MQSGHRRNSVSLGTFGAVLPFLVKHTFAQGDHVPKST